MNNRIRELAEQATSFDFGGERGFDGVNPREFFDKEKFAELIVKECGVALSPMLRDMISRGQAYDLLREHFGVEK